MTIDWQPIDTAPKDGTPVLVKRVMGGKTLFEGFASWRTVTFPALRDPISKRLYEPEYQATGWMRAEVDKRFPEPTHWLPKSD